MGFEAFNPRDKKYAKVADLPIEEQENYRDVEGGFVTREAFQEDIKNSLEAKKRNKKRPLLDKILFKNTISKQDIARARAEIINDDIDFKKLVMALPENEREELRKYKNIEEELATSESEDGLEIEVSALSEKELQALGRYGDLVRKAQRLLDEKTD